MFFHERILQQYKEQCVTFYQILSYTYSLLFVNKNISLDFIKLLCTRDFSRVTFAAELSTNLVYNSIFVIDYDYIFFHLLFFIKIKLSICSRLFLTHKSDDQVNTEKYRNSTLI